MSLVIRGSEFIPAPSGVQPAVCVDVVDLGMVDGAFGTKHKVKVVWEIAATMQDGRRFIVQKQYTASLHEKSSLAIDLKTWRGRALTTDEVKGFDLERIVGVPCQLVIVHNEKDGQTYANIQTILKADPNSRLAPSGNYVRVKNRPADQQPQRRPAPANRMNGTRPAPATSGGFEDGPPEHDGDPYHDPAQETGEQIPF